MKAFCPLCGLESDEFDPRYVREWPEHCGERMQELPAEQKVYKFGKPGKTKVVRLSTPTVGTLTNPTVSLKFTAHDDKDAVRAKQLEEFVDLTIEVWRKHFPDLGAELTRYLNGKSPP